MTSSAFHKQITSSKIIKKPKMWPFHKIYSILYGLKTVYILISAFVRYYWLTNRKQVRNGLLGTMACL